MKLEKKQKTVDIILERWYNIYSFTIAVGEGSPT